MNVIEKLHATLKSKTALFAYLVMIAGLIDQVSPFIAQMVPQQYSGLVVSLLGLIVWTLRWITKKPLEDK